MKDAWITRGFDAFRAGTFGNGGHNLYVSRAGVLQRIHHFDVNQDGHMDLLFCNSQNHWERPPTYVIQDCFGERRCVELPAEGPLSAALADLTGDGYNDLIVGNSENGVAKELNVTIYFGGPEGWCERYSHQLPAPHCTSVAAGDFNGDGKCDIAFLIGSCVRIFFQTDVGLEPGRYVDVKIEAAQIGAADLDGNGCTDLVARAGDGAVRVFWGGPEGLDESRVSETPIPIDPQDASTASEFETQLAEYVGDVTPLALPLQIKGTPHLFVARNDTLHLTPVGPDRSFGESIKLGCAGAVSAATGDIFGNGGNDLVIACRGDRSWVYWDLGEGYTDAARSALSTSTASDVAIGDFDGDGRAEIAISQSNDGESFTTESLVFRGDSLSDRGLNEPTARFETHDARRVFIAPNLSGKSDLVIVNHFARNMLGDIDATIYLGGPDGFDPDRRLSLPGYGAIEGLLLDVNDDGLVDVVLANASENAVDRDPGSYVYLAGRDGFPSTPSITLPTTRAHGVACGDIDRDGYLDLIFCGFDNPDILIFFGNESGFDADNPQRIRIEYDGVVYKEPRWVYLADLNNSGWLDLVIPLIDKDRSFVLWGGPEGFSMNRCQPLSMNGAACVRAVDLTGNGYLDLIAVSQSRSESGPHDSFVYIYWNSEAGLTESRRTLLPANHGNSMSLGDFNNDGRLDLYVGSYADGRVRDLDSYIYWNREGVYFRESDRTRLFTHSSSGSVAGDFNGDGYVDLAVANHKVWGDHMGYSEVWWNGPDGFDPKRTTRLPTSGPHGMTSIEPGAIHDRGPEEYYVSAPYKLDDGARVAGISFDADVPPNTWVKAQLRFASAADELENAPWLGRDGEGSWYENGDSVNDSPAGPWAQYRVALGARQSCGTPRVREVRVEL